MKIVWILFKFGFLFWLSMLIPSARGLTINETIQEFINYMWVGSIIYIAIEMLFDNIIDFTIEIEFPEIIDKHINKIHTIMQILGMFLTVKVLN